MISRTSAASQSAAALPAAALGACAPGRACSVLFSAARPRAELQPPVGLLVQVALADQLVDDRPDRREAHAVMLGQRGQRQPLGRAAGLDAGFQVGGNFGHDCHAGSFVLKGKSVELTPGRPKKAR